MLNKSNFLFLFEVLIARGYKQSDCGTAPGIWDPLPSYLAKEVDSKWQKKPSVWTFVQAMFSQADTEVIPHVDSH